MARGKSRPASPERVQLGDYWLDYRADRDDWYICWYDAAARTRRRRSTSVRGGSASSPPQAAREALARHVIESAASNEIAPPPPVAVPSTDPPPIPALLENQIGGDNPLEEVEQVPRPDVVPAHPAPLALSEIAVVDLLDVWQLEHVANLGDPARYAISVQHWLEFFREQRQLGLVGQQVMAADLRKALIDRFIAYREEQGAGGHTISRDLAAVRGALNYAFRAEIIVAPPFIRDVDAKEKSKPRELVYTYEQIAAILDAAASRPERHHLFLYILIQLSTCGRSEAILDLHAHQLQDRLIHFLAPDRQQSSKRRSIVPIAPTLAPWLMGLEGKVIVYRAEIAEHRRKPGGPTHFERDCYDVGNAFDHCLIEAGLSRVVHDQYGVPVMLPPRRKIGETERRPKLSGIGSPNTLRHTIITEMHRRGVAEAQIETASGHAGEGTNKRNYRHLRPDDLAELIEAVESLWADIDAFTHIHRRTR